MRAEEFVSIIGDGFFSGVPDSLLRALYDYLIQIYGANSHHHQIAANEGNAVALAAGYYLSTQRVPVVYLQNSGIGNIVNPVASLLHPKVYGIPCLFVVGWRGEPETKDEPQHIFQGEISKQLLCDLGMEVIIFDACTTEEDLRRCMGEFQKVFAQGGQAAFLVRKDSLVYEKAVYRNNYSMYREEAIRAIVEASENDTIVATTGKASRELFEIREQMGQKHACDFLTVGSMGHASLIALGIALQCSDKRVWCIDGDGALLMHMGSLPVIGGSDVKNFVHVVINNEAHESVGGAPTAMGKADISEIARACGYERVFVAKDKTELQEIIKVVIQTEGLALVEVKAAIGARQDLGRPKLTPWENRIMFMRQLCN